MTIRRIAAVFAAISGLGLTACSSNNSTPEPAPLPFTVKMIGFNDYHGNLQSPGTFGVNTAVAAADRREGGLERGVAGGGGGRGGGCGGGEEVELLRGGAGGRVAGGEVGDADAGEAEAAALGLDGVEQGGALALGAVGGEGVGPRDAQGDEVLPVRTARLAHR